MKYLSVCSGIEAATVAWHGLGWEPVGFSEIEAFPSAVLAHHYPSVPNLGDMTKYKEWNIGTIDLLVGGTPCQSFSVAGLRKGLEDPRGNLALVYCGILDHFKPKWFVWENVPGVLSSNGGRDFGSFLGAVAELGYGFAYRVLDAQYFGVAQRRRRVFVVGYLGDWEPAAKVLFEPESLRRDTAPSREKGKAIAASTASGVDANGLQRTVGTLCADTHPGAYSGQDAYTGRLVPSVVGASDEGVMYTLTKADVRGVAQPIPLNSMNCFRSPEADPSTGCGVGEEGEAMFTISKTNHHAVAQPINIYGGNKRPDRPEGGFYVRMDEDTSKTLDAASGLNPTCSQGGTAVMQSVAFSEVGAILKGGSGERGYPDPSDGNGHNIVGQSVAQPVAFSGEVSGTLDANYYKGQGSANYGEREFIVQAIAPTLTASNDPSRSPQSSEVTKQVAAVHSVSMAVRRLTPVECERLQGFPDNYTEIPWRGKADTPDGPRYKALGNSMAVPVMRWIGERINTRRAA